MLEALEPAAARRWAFRALAALGEARAEIDALNVYPVPDGDTGTNMFLTLEAAVVAAAKLPADAPVADIADAFAGGALLGARGNSGVILAQLLRGWADTLAEHRAVDGAAAAAAFRRADEQAWRAVNEPVEGTILSVSRAAAEAAGAAGPGLADVVGAAAAAAREALERTPAQLETLARAGVVDAGGRGLVVLLESLADLVLGATRRRPARTERSPVLPAAAIEACEERHDGPAYEVMYLLDAAEDMLGELRGRLSALGDSLVVVGGGGLWNVHVHVDDPGAAVEAGMAAGRPHRIRITYLSAAPRRGPERRRSETGVGLVACAAGPGLIELFAEAGAVVVPAAPGRRPATGQILEAVHRSGADCVVVLPNDGDTLAVAQAAAAVARTEGIRVSVLPTRAQIQGLAAAAVHDPARTFDEDVVAMSAAAGNARDGAVTIAATHGLTSAGECHPGDVLGVVDGDFAVIGRDLTAVAVEVVDRLLHGGGELVTLVLGEGGEDELAEAVCAHVRRTHRHVEFSVLRGGQDRYPLLVGVE